ncbi:MAG: 30S ribosomal protein S12 methylthiotransferase RimO [Clostridia bacterium]|nr:30S ribosomal protein S12 methylthiotransferase RimO [Clostridia bacterium]
MSIKVGFISLGCPKNQTDLELMLARVNNAGFEIVEEDIRADVMIVNTCAFIKSAKEESIEAILDLDWLKKNRSLKGIVVTGCMAQRYFDEIKSELPEVDAVLSLGCEGEICEAIKKVYDGEKYFASSEPEKLVMEGDRVVSTPPYTAYLRIADGCDNRCSYCAIPLIRGGFRSRKIEDVVAEAKVLRGLGVKELCVIAQDTSAYGRDIYGKPSLDRLLKEICREVPDFEWIRLFYCYPDKITDSLIDAIASLPQVVKYIDLPIQHISEPVLKRMNRHGGPEVVIDAIRRLREKIPGIAIRTTVMTGFPGETGKDFDELLAFVKETRFERLGSFVYSREEGTPAYRFDGRVPRKTAERRMERIMEAQFDIAQELNAAKIGTVQTVLVEGWDPVSERWFGRTADSAPEIDPKVYFTSGRRPAEGDFVKVKIEEVLDYDLLGKALREDKK